MRVALQSRNDCFDKFDTLLLDVIYRLFVFFSRLYYIYMSMYIASVCIIKN